MTSTQTQVESQDSQPTSDIAVLFEKSKPTSEFAQDGSPDSSAESPTPNVHFLHHNGGKDMPTQRLLDRFYMVQKLSPPRELKLKLFVAFLFIVIVVGFSVIVHFYKKEELEADIGKMLHFFEGSRELHVDYGSLKDRLVGSLGSLLPLGAHPYNCLGIGMSSASELCLDWKNEAKLMIMYRQINDVSCYDVSWTGVDKDTVLKDCYSLSAAHWYGSGLVRNQLYPIEKWSRPMEAYINGDIHKQEYGGILERYWLSSKGVTITVEEAIPLFVSVNSSGDNQLCLVSSARNGTYSNPSNARTKLNYTICTAPDINTAHNYYLQTVSVLGCIKDDLITKVSWYINENLNQSSVENFVRLVRTHNLAGGFLILNGAWESHPGDLAFDAQRFPRPHEMMNIVRENGLKFALKMHPFSNTDSVSFLEMASNFYSVMDGSNKVPGLTNWQQGLAAVLDVTNTDARMWFLSRARQLQKRFAVDGFSMLGGEISSLPFMYSVKNPAESTVGYILDYLNLINKLAAGDEQSTDCTAYLPITDVTVAAKTQGFPIPLNPGTLSFSWGHDNGLRSVIPRVITMGILGYPLSMAPLLYKLESGQLPDPELYIRWIQLAVCMPVVQIGIPPWEYSNTDVHAAASIAFQFREMVIVPILIDLLEIMKSSNVPVIRPLWWDYPDDEHALNDNSQFLVGNSLLVTPVLMPASSYRDVYLPRGKWQDSIENRITEGPTLVKNHKAPLTEVLYFRKAS